MKIVVAYYQEREERLSCETKFEGSTTLTTTFVTLSSNNYKSLLFLQISFNILSCHILLISIYSISTLSSLPSIIPVIPSSLSRYLLSTQRYTSRQATPRQRVVTISIGVGVFTREDSLTDEMIVHLDVLGSGMEDKVLHKLQALEDQGIL